MALLSKMGAAKFAAAQYWCIGVLPEPVKHKFLLPQFVAQGLTT
jgi:hypothetical protein